MDQPTNNDAALEERVTRLEESLDYHAIQHDLAKQAANRVKPTAPAWLNVDAVISSDVQQEIRRLADEVEALVPEIDRLARSSYEALITYEAAQMKDALMADAMSSDAAHELLRTVTGAGRLFDAWDRVHNLVEVARQERPDSWPAWISEEEHSTRLHNMYSDYTRAKEDRKQEVAG